MSMGYATNGPVADLGENAMQSHIVPVHRDAVDTLAGEGEADAERLGPGGEGAVVVAASLPQPTAVTIEGQQGRDDQIGVDGLGERQGRGTAGGVQFQRLAGGPAAEDHGGGALEDHREAEGGAGRDKGAGQGFGVELRAYGAIDGDEAGGGELVGMGGGALGGERLQRRQSTAGGAGIRAQDCLVRQGQIQGRAFLS